MLSHHPTALLQLSTENDGKIQWLINVAAGEVRMVETKKEYTQGLMFVQQTRGTKEQKHLHPGPPGWTLLGTAHSIKIAGK